MMKVLAFDTTASGLSAALRVEGKTVAAVRQLMTHGQAEALLPALQMVMAEGGVDYADLDLIAVTVGPGSFTGVRVGLATARALGLAVDVPVQGITSTEALAHSLTEEERAGRSVVVVMDSRRGDVFVQTFDSLLTPLGAPFAVAPENIASHLPDGPLLLAGEKARELTLDGRDVRVSNTVLPDAEAMAALAERRFGADAAMPPEPLYIRPPDAALPKDGGRLRP
jgi:tRNA threonylcarbamoyladenosine biosynthesis protein TsaB